MALAKEVATFSFAQGVDTKTDPYQLPFGKLLICENAVFSESRALVKRNGYSEITNLPNVSFDWLSTFHGDLVAIGSTLESYSTASNTWQSHGEIIPIELSVVSAVRSNTSQTQADSVSSGGLTCIAYTDQDPSNLSNKLYKYCIIDSASGNYVVSPVTLTADATYGTPKTYLLPNHFIVLYTYYDGSLYHLRFLAISIYDPTSVVGPVDVATSYTPSAQTAFDAAPFGNSLYVAYNAVAAGGVKMCYFGPNFVPTGSVTLDGVNTATQISVCAENVPLSLNLLWVTYYNSSTHNTYTVAINPAMSIVLAATSLLTGVTLSNIATTATTSVLTLFYEVTNNYFFDNTLPTNYVNTLTCSSTGSVSSPATVRRSIGLASKPFLIGNPFTGTKTYFIATYKSVYQSTYFVIDSAGNIVSKFAYQNGCGYLAAGLPTVSVIGTTASCCYLYQFSITSVNKTQNSPSGQQNLGLYGQKGINIASFTFTTNNIIGVEMGNNLNITGGMMWAYDGFSLTEQNFHLWPDLDLNANTNGTSKAVAITTTGGNIKSGQNYYYIGIYEYQDSQGNVHRSGTSVRINVSKADLSTDTNIFVISFPTLRLTAKTNPAVKLVLYRASDSQPTFYQITKIDTPTLNDLTVDYINITDNSADSSIVGNTILYTNGGVLENTGGRSSNGMTLFDNRLFSIWSEDPNVLDYSQLVLDQTPVEMSLYLTRYVSPTVGSETNTGPMTALAVMDDKLIIFKANGINYISGLGPDATGNNNQYSEPIFITSTVTTDNDESIILTPMGLMFQATYNQGIWLLTRNLETKYVGDAVQAYNQYAVNSAVSIPGTTYVLFSLNSGDTLMYDYYYNQWGTFKNVRAFSSTIYQGLHTYLDPSGKICQETPGVYLDISVPVLMHIKTGWINLIGIQGLQRAYWMFLIGTYSSPHKLYTAISYDYNPAPSQNFNIVPTNNTLLYGEDTPYGNSTVYGGVSNLEQWRINVKQQKCQSLMLDMQETYDPSHGIAVGAGLKLSATTIVFGKAKGWPRVSAANSIG